MNDLDFQYKRILDYLIHRGIEKKDRTGTGTLSTFGWTIRHNMQDGFPLLTTKKMAWKSIVTELLWFLRGDTNIKYLVDNGCHIWDGDAYKAYLRECERLNIIKIDKPIFELNGKNIIVQTYNHGFPELKEDEILYKYTEDRGYIGKRHTKEEFINKIKTDDEFAKQWGELGPIYGRMWRAFDEDSYGGIDQIANLINDLKTNPDSRRLMVTAWHPGYNKWAVLPPCHYGFQVYTRELSLEERRDWCKKHNVILEHLEAGLENEEDDMRACGVPTRAISLMWNQRSVDTFLGLPFNIASYGLLLEIIAKEVNMVPDELIGNLGDVHLYSNHIEQAKE